MEAFFTLIYVLAPSSMTSEARSTFQGQTGRRTDGQTELLYRVSMLTCDKNDTRCSYIYNGGPIESRIIYGLSNGAQLSMTLNKP